MSCTHCQFTFFSCALWELTHYRKQRVLESALTPFIWGTKCDLEVFRSCDTCRCPEYTQPSELCIKAYYFLRFTNISQSTHATRVMHFSWAAKVATTQQRAVCRGWLRDWFGGLRKIPLLYHPWRNSLNFPQSETTKRCLCQEVEDLFSRTTDWTNKSLPLWTYCFCALVIWITKPLDIECLCISRHILFYWTENESFDVATFCSLEFRHNRHNNSEPNG